VGIADRDYMRKPAVTQSRRTLLVTTSALVLISAIVIFPSTRHWIRTHIGSNKPFVMTFKPLGIGPAVQTGRPYPQNDSWESFLPSPAACPASTAQPSAESTLDSERAMICALNYARLREGLTALPVSPELDNASRLKALDIIRCEDFSHAACGKDPRADADAAGYAQVGWGENIYAGSGPFMPARVAADAWLNSPHHRENLFRPQWTEQGVAVVVAPSFRGHENVAIWVSEFGDRPH
jgi:uncharacterized protein YkwD